MIVNTNQNLQVNATHLHVKAEVRYWDGAMVNGVEDTSGLLIPCRELGNWCPIIEIDTGKITNWILGVSASVHYKVCDCFSYTIKDNKGNEIVTQSGYVPSILYPKKDGYGDYIIMDIKDTGVIQNWQPNKIHELM